VKNRFQPKFNIRKGDNVVVTTGDDKDRTKPRRVLAVYPQEGRILVEGVNIVTKHKKPSAQSPQGGIVQEEASIHISNVMLWDATAKAPTRIKRVRNEQGGFARISKISKNGEEIK
jgi:large subunit ribosomal protein L24